MLCVISYLYLNQPPPFLSSVSSSLANPMLLLLSSLISLLWEYDGLAAFLMDHAPVRVGTAVWVAFDLEMRGRQAQSRLRSEGVKSLEM